MPVTVGPSTLTINYDRQFLISQPNATMLPQDDVGFYAHDTRFVSGYGLTLNWRPPQLFDAITVEHFSAPYEFMTPELSLGPGSDAGADGLLPEGSIGLRLERTILESVLTGFSTEHIANTNRVLVGSIFTTLPMVFLVFFFQRYIIKSVATTGGK